MKTIKKIFAGFALLMLTYLLVNANVKGQTVTEFYNQDDNVVVLKLEDFKTGEAPTKVILVYDSNLIALETQKAHLNTSRLINSAVVTCFSAAAGGAASLLTEDFEEGIYLENWMMDPFIVRNDFPETYIADKEEEQVLEGWMLSSKTWNKIK